MSSIRDAAPEPFGRRVARLRAQAGLTQQQIADRLALSRNAVSHVETGLTHPSERTVVLLAGLFRVEPHSLVADTDYPEGKADRLPLVAARYTEVDARLLRLGVELDLIGRLPAVESEPARRRLLEDLHLLREATLDASERQRLDAAIDEVSASWSRNLA